MKTGLVSVTFRQLLPEQVIFHTKAAGLEGIEWGGDIHVPHGDTRTAERVGKLTRDARLEVLSYGSYFRPGAQAAEEFLPVLDTAAALGAPVIRVWAGAKGSAEADEADFREVVDGTCRICDMAANRGITICYEYHDGTLTDTPEGAVRLMERIGRENMRLYWQPKFNLSHGENLRALEMVIPYLHNVHAFTWDAEFHRYPLAGGVNRWQDYARLIRESSNANAVLLEFVRGDDPAQLLEDAKTLKVWF